MNKLSIIFLFIFITATSCEEEFEVFEGGEFSLILNAPITLIDGSVLEVQEIEDSRCPEGVDCIWEGRASVLVNWGRNENHSIQLNNVEYLSQVIERFKVSFLTLTPYPENNNTAIAKVARIRIELN